MKSMKILVSCACFLFFLAAPVTAAEKKTEKQTCCQEAAANGKECRHKCCVAAHKEGKSCQKCNPNKEDLKLKKSAQK